MKKLYENLLFLFKEKKINLSFNEKNNIIEYSFDIIIHEYSRLKDSDIFKYQIFIKNEFLIINQINNEEEEKNEIFRLNLYLFDFNEYLNDKIIHELIFYQLFYIQNNK